MPLAYDTDNYLYGKGRLYFRRDGEDGYLDLGNVPKFEINVELSKTDHYSSRSGTKQKDKSVVTEKKANAAFDLEEYSAENLDLAFLGDGVQAGAQSAGSIDAQAVLTVANRFVALGKTDISILRIAHGTVAGGPFQVGETITGGTSAATAKIAWVGSGFIECIDVSGTFAAGETITGGTSTGSATASGAETLSDAVVVDAAAPTVRYALGADYDIDAVEGLIRERAGGSIAGNACYVSADHAAKSTNSVRALANSSCSGELLFVGDPDDGPRWRVQCWKSDLTIGGAAGFISEEATPIPMTADILADATNHPNEPFFRATEAY